MPDKQSERTQEFFNKIKQKKVLWFGDSNLAVENWTFTIGKEDKNYKMKIKVDLTLTPRLDMNINPKVSL